MTLNETTREHVANALQIVISIRADLDTLEARLRAALAQLQQK